MKRRNSLQRTLITFTVLCTALLLVFNSCQKNEQEAPKLKNKKKIACWPGFPDRDQYGNPIEYDGDTPSEFDCPVKTIVGGSLPEVNIYRSYTPWTLPDPWKSEIPYINDFDSFSDAGGSTGSGSGGGSGVEGEAAGSIGVEYNGERDPDFGTDCGSFAYQSTSNGDYQVCGVSGLRFDFTTEYVNLKGQVQFDYYKATFEKIVYFEFPRKRKDGTFINAREAAIASAKAKDYAEEILESQIENSPPPNNGVELELLLRRYMGILSSQMQLHGGRVTFRNNYQTSSVKSYSKTVYGTGGC
ncbi:MULTISPECIES: hypothetical protein [Bacteroidota]|uniref:hypothetical protein n=1 Tax=Bacteroidota TaxID=976 RepID=UPI002FD96C78